MSRPATILASDRPVVAATDLVRTYRQGETLVTALRSVSFAVRAGEFVAVMGPSGSGKSTLLHLLAGLEAPDVGTVVVADHALDAMSDDARTVFRRRHIGIVFQAFNLLPTLTAEENVALPLLMDGETLGGVRPRVTDALDRVGMLTRRSHVPDQLSGGEQQRVAVARALVTEPLVILADEPTGNLDSRSAEHILLLLHESATQRSQTIVMVTHDARAAGYARRVVQLVDGMVDERTPASILDADGGRRCVRGGC
jgi:putative ABC transport system ATP-binding protein